MALKKSEKRLLIVLGVALVVFLFDRFVLSAKKKEDPQIQPPASESISQDLAVNQLNPATPTPIQVQKRVLAGNLENFEDWGRDPFNLNAKNRLSGLSVKKPVRPVLNGIFLKDGQSYALINDLIFHEGEEKNGIKVEKIKEMEVLCTQGKSTFTLSWRESP
jgi:hypothetical protein